jgi:hypothetical protein
MSSWQWKPAADFRCPAEEATPLLAAASPSAIGCQHRQKNSILMSQLTGHAFCIDFVSCAVEIEICDRIDFRPQWLSTRQGFDPITHPTNGILYNGLIPLHPMPQSYLLGASTPKCSWHILMAQ